MIVQKIVELLLAEPSVASIVGDRVHPNDLPDAPTYPALVVHKAAGVGNYTMAGDVGIEDARVQVDCFGERGYDDLVGTLKTAVRRFLSGFTGGGDTGIPCTIQTCMVINDFDLNETATERSGPRLRRRVLEFRVWNKEI